MTNGKRSGNGIFTGDEQGPASFGEGGSTIYTERPLFRVEKPADSDLIDEVCRSLISYPVEACRHIASDWKQNFVADVRRLARVNGAPMNQVGRAFNDVLARDIPTQDDAHAVAQTFLARLRTEMNGSWFTTLPPAAVGPRGCASDGFALVLLDQSLAVKFPRVVHHALDIFAVIAPRSVTRAQLRDAAALRVHDRADGGIRTLVAIVKHPIVVIIATIRFGPELHNPAIPTAQPWDGLIAANVVEGFTGRDKPAVRRRLNVIRAGAIGIGTANRALPKQVPR